MNAPHPQQQQLAEAHDAWKATAFVPSAAGWAAAINSIKQSQLTPIAVVFKGVDVTCFGTYTPNSDGYCDNGGFDIERVEHCGEDITSLFSKDDMERLDNECFDEYERDAKEAAEYAETDV